MKSMNFLKFQLIKLNFKRGFVIFVIVGIVAVLGMVLTTLSWMTRQQNTQSHKALYNEVARTSAEAAAQLLIRALREGIQTPSETSIQKLLNDPYYAKHSFYGYFLQPMNPLNPAELKLTDSELLQLFPEHLKSIFSSFRDATPGLEINLEVIIRTDSLYSNSSSGEIMRDQVEKKLDLELWSKATYKGATKSFRVKKYLMVYNLINPLTSKFTLFHKSGIGNRYNQLITNLFGKPILNNFGGFKYRNNFPLILVNGPLGDDPIRPGDSVLLAGKGGNDFEDMNHLSGPDHLRISRETILKRGFLYFGPGQDNIMNLTPGSDLAGWGEYFHLFNPFIGSNPETYPAEILNTPDFFKGSYPVQNGSPLNTQTQGSLILQSLYEGFYEPDEHSQFRPSPGQGIINGYSAYSSLIHPFGSNLAVSRAYTVGNAFRAVAKVSSLSIDRVDDFSDEQEQQNCLQVPSIQKRDGRLAILRETTLEGWQGNRQFTLNPLSLQMDNLHKMRPSPDGNQYLCVNEPDTFRVGPEFNYDSIFPEFDQYANFMSTIHRIPINHTIDFPHYTHRIIPPNDHEDFSQFMFPPHDKKRLFELPDNTIESWVLATSKLHPEGSLYLQGDSDSFDVDNLHLARQHLSLFHPTDGVLALQEEGYLRKVGSKLFLNTRGHTVSIAGNLTLEEDLVVEEHSSVIVDGNCLIGNVETNFYFNLHCRNIILRNPSKQDQLSINAFLNARGALSKQNELTSVSIQGGLAIGELDFSIFQAPTAVLYNTNFSPLDKSYQFFYRIVMDDHNRDWQGQI